MGVKCGKLERGFRRGLAGADDSDPAAAEEGGVTGRTVADAAPDQLILAGYRQTRRRTSGGDDHGASPQSQSLPRMDFEAPVCGRQGIGVLALEGVDVEAAHVAAEL